MKLALTTSALAFSISLPATAGMKVLSPGGGGFAFGPRVPVVVGGCKRPRIELEVDGEPAGAKWKKTAYEKTWRTELELDPGPHRLKWRQRCRILARRGEIRFDVLEGAPAGPALALASDWLHAHPARKRKWQWGAGIALFGYMRLAEVLAGRDAHGALRNQILEYVSRYHAHHLREGLPEINYPDRSSPGLSAMLHHRMTGEPDMLLSVMAAYDYYKSEERLEIGAINHLGHHFYSWFVPPSIWVDSMMMYVLPSVIMGHELLDDELKRFGLRQYRIFASRLQAPDGLFYHAWNVDRKRLIPRRNAARWLRGNGWVAASTVEAIDHARGSQRDEILEAFRRQMSGALPHRLPDGLWDTIMDAPGYSYPETSGSALVAYAMLRGARMGYLPAGFRRHGLRTYRGLVSRLKREDGRLSLPGISSYTNAVSKRRYARIRRKDDLTWGVGAFMLLTSEVLRLTNSR